MKTKTLFVVGIIGMAAALAPKARADFAISITLGSPAVYHVPAVIPPPPPICPPPVVVARPIRVWVPTPVCVPPPPVCRPVVFVPPGHAKKYDRHGWDRKG